MGNPALPPDRRFERPSPIYPDGGQPSGASPPGSTSAAGSLAQFQEQRASGVDSSTSLTDDTWSTRILNTTVSNTINGCSLASNQVTLPAGTYDFRVVASYFASDTNLACRTRLYNVTASAVINTSPYTLSEANIEQQNNVLQARATFTETTIVELQSYIQALGGGNGGTAANDGDPEVYTDFIIEVPGGGSVGPEGPEGPQGPEGPVGGALTGRVVSGSDTLVLGDAGNLVTFGGSSVATETFPLHASVPWVIWTQISFINAGSANWTLAGAGPPTLNSQGGLLTLAPGAACVATYYGSDVWWVTGNLS